MLEEHITNLKCFDPYNDFHIIFQLKNQFEHTMAEKLDDYISNKIHSNSSPHIISKFIPEYSKKRDNTIISDKEKNNKLFNFQRPTLDIKDSTKLYIFPGNDYILHYNLLYNYYLNRNRELDYLQDISHIENTQVSFGSIWNSLNLPKHIGHSVILGYVDFIKNDSSDWEEWEFNNQFGYCFHKTKKVMLLGCKHSYWGDIAGVLLYKLASYGARNVLYIGKLGALNNGLIPNETIVSGSISYLRGNIIDWSKNNLCSKLNLNKVKHYSLPSTMLETKAWAIKARTEFDVVDPEIGHMGLQALQCGINFGYMHLVTDSLLNENEEEGLHNESKFKDKREQTLNKLKQNIFNLPIW